MKNLNFAYLKSAFNKYNDKYFYGALIEPTFEFTNTKRKLGCCIMKKRGWNNQPHFTIQISKFLDRSEKDIDNTIIHEMIHLYAFQQYPNDRTKHGHGAYFVNWCNKINKDGWNLSRTNSTEGVNVAEHNLNKNNTYEVCVGYHNTRKSYFVAVLATNKVKYFIDWLTTDKRYKNVQFFRSKDNSTFAKMRVSRTKLNLELIDNVDNFVNKAIMIHHI